MVVGPIVATLHNMTLEYALVLAVRVLSLPLAISTVQHVLSDTVWHSLLPFLLLLWFDHLSKIIFSIL